MTDTPARPALDEGDEPTPESILIAAWKLRFNKAFRPEEEAGALMAFLDTVGLCVVSKRALADMRGALEKISTNNCEHQIYRVECCPSCIAREALARSAP